MTTEGILVFPNHTKIFAVRTFGRVCVKISRKVTFPPVRSASVIRAPPRNQRGLFIPSPFRTKDVILSLWISLVPFPWTWVLIVFYQLRTVLILTYGLFRPKLL